MRLWESRLGDVIEKILRGHRRAGMVGGLWQPSAPRASLDVDGLVHELDCDCSDQTPELTYVDIDTFLATFESPPTHAGTETVPARRGIHPRFAVRSIARFTQQAPNGTQQRPGGRGGRAALPPLPPP